MSALNHPLADGPYHIDSTDVVVISGTLGKNDHASAVFAVAVGMAGSICCSIGLLLHVPILVCWGC